MVIPRTRSFWLVATLCLSFCGRVEAAENDRGANLAATCAACHRLDGRDTGIPAIVGLAPETLAGMMRAFRADESSNHIMHAVSLSLSDKDIGAVALYLSAISKGTKQP